MSRKVEISQESPDSQAVIVNISNEPAGEFWNKIQETRRYESPKQLLRDVRRELAFRYAQLGLGLTGAFGVPSALSTVVSQDMSPDNKSIIIPVGIAAVAAFCSGVYIAYRGTMNIQPPRDILSEAKRSITQRFELIRPTAV